MRSHALDLRQRWALLTGQKPTVFRPPGGAVWILNIDGESTLQSLLIHKTLANNYELGRVSSFVYPAVAGFLGPP